MKDRLQQLLEKKGISSTRFAELVGVQRSSVSHILSGRNNPGLDFIQKILAAFPDVSSDWLISGKGDLYRDKRSTPVSNIKDSERSLKNLFDQRGDFNPSKPISAVISAQKEEKESTDAIESKIAGNIVEKQSTNNPRPRLVERIVIFYTDRTFSEFFPD